MIYDANKKLISVGDIYPGEAKLEKKDTYTIKLLVRHDSPALLQRMQDLPMVVERKLKDPISLSIYPSMADAQRESSAVKEFVLSQGNCLSQRLLCGGLTTTSLFRAWLTFAMYIAKSCNLHTPLQLRRESERLCPSLGCTDPAETCLVSTCIQNIFRDLLSTQGGVLFWTFFQQCCLQERRGHCLRGPWGRTRSCPRMPRPVGC